MNLQIIGKIGNATMHELLYFIAVEEILKKTYPDATIFNPLRLKGNAYESMLVCIDNLINYADNLVLLPNCNSSAGAKIELLIYYNLHSSKKCDLIHLPISDIEIETYKINVNQIKIADYNRILRQRIKEFNNDK